MTGTDDQRFETATSREQLEVEQLVANVVNELLLRHRNRHPTEPLPHLLRNKHTRFITRAILDGFPPSYQNLDASGPWLCYWTVHAMNLLGITLADSTKSAFVRYLNQCKHPQGGYGGGPRQIAHLAATYGAVNCLISLGTREAYDSIDREKLLPFLVRLHQSDGSFIMHEGGEVDVRGTYCALAVARLTNLLCEELTNKSAEFVLECQSYEGGFGGLPGLEAHGGYTFCSIAALAILEAVTRCDLPKLLNWLIMRQCPFEGGFNGRTNKLVDTCYSFWQAGAIPIVYRALSLNEKYVDALPVDKWLFNQRALQEYILACCQAPNGGLIDKPGKPADYYHTCYALSGLSIAQHFTFLPEPSITLIGSHQNLVEITDPVHNLRQDFVEAGLAHFGRLPVPTLDQN
ncbi:protein farnesyltransferase subunit beta-like isoform X3 [Varroa jacobsoni]|uniref:Protein farnesyltransferase subunit beta n=1 Tax=Varroa destructor TaxID=109461 RepID=A0A7M7MCD8_VARDE|nr:protein farnesyltransferase subunit beta-like isoform X2 [Varroa destructor]XP_022651790.1 protein farnesyltransferase subunit beta-like isoform X3 [Varroa destructor]XP_022693509.1 protein farnesyltransferase subunit beta-like isoform X2 [Varroa jacobsoni]XP_022693589.1 protein farnesyltransferase subunit beta-like isoform X3 [Varroa jacobsoni]